MACLLLVCACHAGADNPTTLEELRDAGRLAIDSKLDPRENLVPGQRTRLTLKVSTDRWFTGGTRIVIPEVPGLVILQVDEFASNSSENRQGQNWVVQRWTLDVYPQRAGAFNIPPIDLKIKVNAGDAGELEGELTAPPLTFEATVPETLVQADATHWVAAPVFKVGQSFDRSLDELQPGDAFEREIIFEADDVMAMMLPSFTAEPQEGLASYPQPPELQDSTNRGQASARRVERTSYVVEASGQYTLPPLEYFWWDTTKGELTLLSLPAVEISAGIAIESEDQQTNSPLNIKRVLSGLAAAALLALALWLLVRFWPTGHLVKCRRWLAYAWQQLMDLRKPALPERLNPGSSAGD